MQEGRFLCDSPEDSEDDSRKVTMKTVLAAMVAAVAALAMTASASAEVQFGISDDHGKYSDDGGAWFFGEMSTIGLSLNKMTVNWDPTRPDVITEKGFLDRAIPEATQRGVEVSLGVHIGKARAITGSPGSLAKFTAFLQLLARTYPEVTEIVVGNEPNLTRFWQPQFNADGSGASGIAFAAFLAASYDALKEVNPNITVVGIGLSPRGNDRPDAASNISTSPVKFIRDLGIGYRRLGRAKPIMDVFGFHPYPARDTDSLLAGYAWPNAGVANLDRIKQAVWDAFHGTGQPTFPEGRVMPVERDEADPDLEEPEYLTFKLDEVGWQVGIPPVAERAYHGRESVRPTDEGTQARIYGELVRMISCDPAVKQLLFFGLIDEPNLDRWQAGMIRADRSRRPSYRAVQAAIAETEGRCTGRPVVWRHTTKVVGAKASFGRGRIVLSVGEDATFVATAHAAAGGRALASVSGTVKAHRPVAIRLRARGASVYRVRVRAAMNRARTSVLSSRPVRG